ncbi:MAG: sporulation protein [Rhodobacterales bacterium]|nr:MAG: sporulation protein [Rhodobacterales bacterium]
MADFDSRGFEIDSGADQPDQIGAAVHPGKIGKLINTAGMVMSVGLVIGIGIWGYRLLVRDVSGVPVVRALQGPMRVQPEDPGGTQTANQGLAVNNVQSAGLVGDLPNRLVLAPSGPGIGEQDQPGLHRPARNPNNVAQAQTPPATADAAPAMAQNTDPGAAITSPVLLTVSAPMPKDDMRLPTAPPPGAVSATDAAVNQALAETPPPEDKPKIKIISASIPGVSHSPRPRLRPASLNTSPAALSATRNVSASLSGTEVDPNSIKPGTRLAQLGAFGSPEIARAEWDKLMGRFTEYMEGKTRVIQKAHSGGRTFYRLRAMGFEDLSDARRFCSALVAEKAACIPVKVR